MTVPAGVIEFEYIVTMPPWMEIGRTSRAVVMATGTIREPDGTNHEVNFSDPKNEIQITAVVGPGVIGLDLGRTSIALAPRRTVDVPVKVSRGKGIDGPIRVELLRSAGIRGVSAQPLILKAGRNEGTLRVVCDRSIDGPPAATLILQAAAIVGGEPVTAEAPLSVVADMRTIEPTRGKP